MMQFSPVRFDDQALREYEALFAACFPPSAKFKPDALHWLYIDNPDGQAIGFDAYEGNVLAAHYVCVPARARVNGADCRVLLSLNTATHPSFQGKGLFTKLADMTYTSGAEQGFSAVYGVANANSTPGFVRKLKFQLVTPLRAMIGVGGLNMDLSAARNGGAQFERRWTPDSLRWRCSNPVSRVQVSEARAVLRFTAKAFGRALPAYAELENAGMFAETDSNGLVSPLRLYLGLMPAGACHFGGYFEIPQKLRPSPLNFIFRPLVDTLGALDADRIFFTFLDFDAY